MFMAFGRLGVERDLERELAADRTDGDLNRRIERVRVDRPSIRDVGQARRDLLGSLMNAQTRPLRAGIASCPFHVRFTRSAAARIARQTFSRVSGMSMCGCRAARARRRPR